MRSRCFDVQCLVHLQQSAVIKKVYKIFAPEAEEEKEVGRGEVNEGKLPLVFV